MMNSEQVAEKMQQGGKLDISAQFDGVMIHGIAAVDAVIGTRGKVKMRARFGHGIKAVFELGEYGECWQAEAVTEEQPAATVTASTTEAGSASATICAETEPAPAAEGQHSANYDRVQRWRRDNPAGSKKACARETALSLPTIRRYWNGTA